LREIVNSLNLPPRRRFPRLARGWALPAAPRRRRRVPMQVPVVLALTLVAVALAASELDAHPLLRATRPAESASTAVWRVWSANSDQHAGSLVFTVKGAAPAGGLAAALLAVARFILLGALLVLAGGLGFLLLIWPDGLGAPRLRRLFAGAWTAAVTAPLAGVRLHAVATWGVPPAVGTFIRQPRGRLEENG
jgi:hypothetical protein